MFVFSLSVCVFVSVHRSSYKSAFAESGDRRKEETVIPRRVLVRFYGGNVLPKNNPIRTLNETSEALLFLILGQKGLGPQLYGCFEGGRVEEFIPSRNLTVSEFASCDLVNRAIASIVARYHCLGPLPLAKCPWNVSAIVRNSYAKYKQSVSAGQVDKLMNESLKEKLKDFLHYDVVREVEWIEGTLGKINSRVVFTHNDINRSNILLRTRENSCTTVTSCHGATAATAEQESGGNNNNQGCNYNHLPSLLEANKSPANESISSTLHSATGQQKAEAQDHHEHSYHRRRREDWQQPETRKKEQRPGEGNSIDKEVNCDDDSLNDLVDKLLLVDYEFSGYNYRGIDIGNHFAMKVFDFGTNYFITGHPYPSEKERRAFIHSYQKEVRLSGAFEDWDEEKGDSEEHILMEAEFGSLIRRLSNISGILGSLETWIPIAAKRSTIDPSFKNGRVFSMFVSFYQERKAAFLKQWPQFASES